MIKEGNCTECSRWISKNVAWVSMRNFGKYLCYDCQIKLKVKMGLITPYQAQKFYDVHTGTQTSK